MPRFESLDGATSDSPLGAALRRSCSWYLRNWLRALQPCFTARSWEHVLVIVMGAVLAPDKRTITACLRMTGRADAGWARQGMPQLCRWLPGRSIVFVGDSRFAVHELAHAVSGRATLISRLRLDANLFAPPPPRQAHSIGRPAQKGAPLPKLKTLLSKPTTLWRRVTASSWYGRETGKELDISSDTALWYRRGTPPRPVRWFLVRDPDGKRAPQAFFSTDTSLEPTEIIALFVRRWQIEVTFAETRAHLGVETQRQWSYKAIARTTPALLGLYSLITLWASDLLTATTQPQTAAWYRKRTLTFVDAIGAVRLALWLGDNYRRSPHTQDMRKIPPDRLTRMAETLCFAA